MKTKRLNNDLLAKSYELAMKVDFLETSQEVRMYAESLCEAMMWGKKIDEQKINKMICKNYKFY